MAAYENVHRELVGVPDDPHVLFAGGDARLRFKKPDDPAAPGIEYVFRATEDPKDGFYMGILSDRRKAMLVPRPDVPGGYVLFVALPSLEEVGPEILSGGKSAPVEAATVS